jgi:hypothetical protein
VPFLAEGGHGVPVVCGLSASDKNGIPPLDVFATLAACTSAVVSPNHLVCVNVAFSHAKASC